MSDSNLRSPSPHEFKALRQTFNLSQAQVADLLAVSKNSVKNWEAGRSQCAPAIWAFFQIKMEEKRQEILTWIEEHTRRWNSKVYREQWRREAREKYGD